MTLRAKSKPIEVEMLQWNANEADMRDFIPEEGQLRFPNNRFEVWNKEEMSWINVPHGHYVVKGTRGELTVISPVAKESTYEEI